MVYEETRPQQESRIKPLSGIKRVVLLICGTFFLALGIVGAFLPVLPTTPFVLLAAFCYIRSSERMYQWVMNSKFAGENVRNVLAGKGIPLSVKIVSLAISAVMIGYVSLHLTENFWVRMLLGAIYLVQLVFMLTIKTLKHDR